MKTPVVKEAGQFFYDLQAEENKGVAKNRVCIEELFGNCRTHAAFQNRIHLSSLDLADLEAEVARGLVNFWGSPHGWELTGAREKVTQK